MQNTPRYWYGAKIYPFGCRLAVTWEGWLIDVVWFATFVALSPFVNERSHAFLSLGLVFGVIAVCMAIRHWKGEPQRSDD
jgi:hypothetical protein